MYILKKSYNNCQNLCCSFFKMWFFKKRRTSEHGYSITYPQFLILEILCWISEKISHVREKKKARGVCSCLVLFFRYGSVEFFFAEAVICWCLFAGTGWLRSAVSQGTEPRCELASGGHIWRAKTRNLRLSKFYGIFRRRRARECIEKNSHVICEGSLFLK